MTPFFFIQKEKNWGLSCFIHIKYTLIPLHIYKTYTYMIDSLVHLIFFIFLDIACRYILYMVDALIWYTEDVLIFLTIYLYKLDWKWIGQYHVFFLLYTFVFFYFKKHISKVLYVSIRIIYIIYIILYDFFFHNLCFVFYYEWSIIYKFFGRKKNYKYTERC